MNCREAGNGKGEAGSGEEGKGKREAGSGRVLRTAHSLPALKPTTTPSRFPALKRGLGAGAMRLERRSSRAPYTGEVL